MLNVKKYKSQYRFFHSLDESHLSGVLIRYLPLRRNESLGN